MGVNVDQTGNDIRTLQIDGTGLFLSQHMGKAALLYGEAPQLEAKALGKYHGVFKVHKISF